MRRKFSALLLLVLSIVSPLAAKGGESFALVLSGGGAKGYAQIAVLQELDRRGIVPDIVIGTSMGALIGGLYAAGYTGDEILDLCLRTDINAMITKPYSVELDKVIDTPFAEHSMNLLSLSIGSAGITNEGGLINDKDLVRSLRKFVIKVYGIRDFDELPTPFRAVTTDIISGDRVTISSGELNMAMRASMSIPILFAPVELPDGGYGMDGGFTSNMSSDVARELGYDVVLSVDVNDFLYRYGEPERDTGSLLGVFDALTCFLSSRNAEELYALSDYVIVPETFTTLDYNSVAEMYKTGVAAVEANQAVFDELEARVGGGKSRLLYHDIEPAVIESVVVPDISPAHKERLEGYVGKALDSDMVEMLEEDLELIRMHSRLKSVDFDMQDGVLYVTTEEFDGRYGEVSIGFGGNVGVRYDGDDTFFTLVPDFGVSLTNYLSSGLSLSFGLGFDQGLRLDGGFSYPLLSSSYVYSLLEVKYGQLSWPTAPGTSYHEFGSDVSVGLLGGFGQMLRTSVRWDALLGVDFTRVNNILDTDTDHYLYVYAGADFVYDGYEGESVKDNGSDIRLMLTAGIDTLEPSLGYSVDFDASGVYGGSKVKFIYTLEASSIRRPLYLSEAYTITRIGRYTTDELFGLAGVAVPLPKNTYAAAGVFLDVTDTEGQERRHSEWSGEDFVPFSQLEFDETSFGAYISGGIKTSFGRVFAELYVSSYPGVSFLIGFR